MTGLNIDPWGKGSHPDPPAWQVDPDAVPPPGDAAAPPDVLTLRPPPSELSSFLAEPEPAYDWLVEGLLERGDRLILTGAEGSGKSTLLRQLAVQLAAGIHPFTLEPTDPVRVLLVDLENSRRHIRRQLRTLHAAAGDDYQPEPGMFVDVQPAGLDLLAAEDRAWLAETARTVAPGVLVIGPLYKLANGDPTEEGPAKAAAAALDGIRFYSRCAVLLEAHTPHATAASRVRPKRPYGASLWLRWPEFGLHLGEDGTLSEWRPPRDERDWPALLQRGGAWPWTRAVRPRDELWARIVGYCTEAGDQLRYRDLAELTGSSKTTVMRTVDEHREQWDRLAGKDVK